MSAISNSEMPQLIWALIWHPVGLRQRILPNVSVILYASDSQEAFAHDVVSDAGNDHKLRLPQNSEFSLTFGERIN
jgi:hypothetical protein